MNELELIRNHFLGFHNDFFNNFRKVSTYPPYNIKEKDDKGIIEFAVAGFAEKDLKIEVRENTLSVYGCRSKEKHNAIIRDEKSPPDFFHKGISDRSFEKKFQLHKHIVVDNAELKDGLLKIYYYRDIPEAEKPKTIKIKSN